MPSWKPLICWKRDNMNKEITIGQQFGDLEVLYEVPHAKGDSCRWHCRCACGKECDVSSYRLHSGVKTHCGCRTTRGHRKFDITGQRFQMLTALYETGERDRNGSVIWHCRCDCGKELDISYGDLKYSKITSCGCYKRKKAGELHENYVVCAAGTSVTYLEKAKIRSDNKTGIKGVFYFRGKYIAEITFQKKCYRLGKFNTLENAVEARKQAERILHGDFLDFYSRWKRRADSDPEWGVENPVSVKVNKTDTGELRVVMLPEL